MPSIKSLLSGLFRASRYARRDRAETIYAAIAAQARQPDPYRDHDVPDTLDGRFDALCLHVFLTIRRLGRDGDPGAELARDIYDVLFADMDRALREMGVGDLGVARRVQRMAEALNGRIKAYGAALDDAADMEGALEAALSRNLYGTVAAPRPQAVAAVARYVLACDRRLSAQSFEDLIARGPDFAEWEPEA